MLRLESALITEIERRRQLPCRSTAVRTSRAAHSPAALTRAPAGYNAVRRISIFGGPGYLYVPRKEIVDEACNLPTSACPNEMRDVNYCANSFGHADFAAASSPNQDRRPTCIERVRLPVAMALKDLLVYADQKEGARFRLRLAADLASRHKSRLTVLFVREFNHAQLDLRKNAELGLVSAEDLDRLDQHIQSSIDQAADRLRSMIQALGSEHHLEVEWRCVDGPAWTSAPQHARYADLCIVGPNKGDDDVSIGSALSQKLLFVTGRPVVFVPSFGSFETLGRHIVVGWNESHAATRAVSDALPLIERADRTTVITIESEDFVDRDGGRAADKLVQHLRRHNPSVGAVKLKNVPARSIADVLQGEAGTLGADLIVTGAYGHSKLWEDLVGGITHDLLNRMKFPVFMSH
jgi:nucleotide-binding universal stress UspA family protein